MLSLRHLIQPREDVRMGARKVQEQNRSMAWTAAAESQKSYRYLGGSERVLDSLAGGRTEIC